jgi:cysteine-rich repeat protein
MEYARAMLRRNDRLLGAGLLLVQALVVAVAGSCGARTGLDKPDVEPEPSGDCGDGIVSGGEECDAGNAQPNDRCRPGCVLAFCGDGEVRPGEACDDGNTVDGDGCNADCSLSTCGDGLLDAGEECDSPAPERCTPNCTLPFCGDGFVSPGEECDAGPENGLSPALAVVHAGAETPIAPFFPGTDYLTFYDFQSASSHTGLEEPNLSQLFFVLDGAGLHLLTIHNIDQDSSGTATGEGEVTQDFIGLPVGTEVEFADDREEEFSMSGDTSAVGTWTFNNNTDGGVMGVLPFPGDWVVEVESEFSPVIDRFLTRDPSFDVDLELGGEPVFLVARSRPGPCRPDCTLSFCGDGTVDGGEVCDPGNLGAPPCLADCSAFL